MCLPRTSTILHGPHELNCWRYMYRLPRYTRTFYYFGSPSKFNFFRDLSLAYSRFIEDIKLKKWRLSGIHCSLIIRGFSIRGNLKERIYCELRGKPGINFTNIQGQLLRQESTNLKCKYKKATRLKLVKLTPGFNFINVLRAAFT